MRLDEVPALIGRERDLAQLDIDDVMIRPVIGADEVLGWLAIVAIERSDGDRTHNIPWILGLRATEEDARGAVTALLEGLLAGRTTALRDFPAITARDEAKEARNALIQELADEWHQRKFTDESQPAEAAHLTKPGTRMQDPWDKLTGETASRPRRGLVHEVPSHLIEWGQLVKETRSRWGWTQKDLAERAQLDAPRLSKIERGKWVPPDDVIDKLCEVLDLPHPNAPHARP